MGRIVKPATTQITWDVSLEVPRSQAPYLAKGERRGVSSTWTATTPALIFRR